MNVVEQTGHAETHQALRAPTAPITRECFADAYLKGYRMTVRFLLAKGANVDVAEELAQSAWARGWEAREQLQLEDRILPWVNSIAYHRFCNDQRRARHVELTEITDTKVPSAAMALDAEKLLNLCSPFDKTLLMQRYVDGMELKEIAAAQGLSEIAVRVRIHRCRCCLRSLVENGGRASRGKRPRQERPEGDQLRPQAA
jgi:RNA polymerase sigma factor (sigma-70 family)